MLTFTLAIYCLATSNLPWFRDLILRPMQYCSLQHRTLLPSPATSTTCFCFDSISSFFLELFLHWSPVAYWAPIDLWSSSFSVLSFSLFILFMGFSRQEKKGKPFHTVHGVLKARLKWFPFSSGPRFVRILFHDAPVLGGSTQHSSEFIELDKTMAHVIGLVSFLWLWFSVYLPSDGEG